MPLPQQETSPGISRLCFTDGTVMFVQGNIVKLVGGEVALHGGGHLTSLAVAISCLIGSLWQVLVLMGPWLLTVTHHSQHLHGPRENPGGKEVTY